MRKKDTKKILSLWHGNSDVAWSPTSYDVKKYKNLMKAYSYKELQKMADQLGIDKNINKSSLAECIATESLIFFPDQAGNYTYESLAYMVKKFKLVDDNVNLQKLKSAELQKILLEAWKGGSTEEMNITIQHIIELHQVMKGIENKFCSTHVKDSFRKPYKGDNVSLHDRIEHYMSEVLDLYQKWSNATDQKEKRKYYIQTKAANTKAENGVTAYLNAIRKYCKNKLENHCVEDKMPHAIQEWYRTSQLIDKVVLCNVTVRGRILEFTVGDTLVPTFIIQAVAVVTTEEKEKIIWLAVARDEERKSQAVPTQKPGNGNTLALYPNPPPTFDSFNRVQTGQAQTISNPGKEEEKEGFRLNLRQFVKDAATAGVKAVGTHFLQALILQAFNIQMPAIQQQFSPLPIYDPGSRGLQGPENAPKMSERQLQTPAPFHIETRPRDTGMSEASVTYPDTGMSSAPPLTSTRYGQNPAPFHIENRPRDAGMSEPTVTYPDTGMSSAPPLTSTRYGQNTAPFHIETRPRDTGMSEASVTYPDNGMSPTPPLTSTRYGQTPAPFHIETRPRDTGMSEASVTYPDNGMSPAPPLTSTRYGQTPAPFHIETRPRDSGMSEASVTYPDNGMSPAPPLTSTRYGQTPAPFHIETRPRDTGMSEAPLTSERIGETPWPFGRKLQRTTVPKIPEFAIQSIAGFTPSPGLSQPRPDDQFNRERQNEETLRQRQNQQEARVKTERNEQKILHNNQEVAQTPQTDNSRGYLNITPSSIPNNQPIASLVTPPTENDNNRPLSSWERKDNQDGPKFNLYDPNSEFVFRKTARQPENVDNSRGYLNITPSSIRTNQPSKLPFAAKGLAQSSREQRNREHVSYPREYDPFAKDNGNRSPTVEPFGNRSPTVEKNTSQISDEEKQNILQFYNERKQREFEINRQYQEELRQNEENIRKSYDERKQREFEINQKYQEELRRNEESRIQNSKALVPVTQQEWERLALEEKRRYEARALISLAQNNPNFSKALVTIPPPVGPANNRPIFGPVYSNMPALESVDNSKALVPVTQQEWERLALEEKRQYEARALIGLSQNLENKGRGLITLPPPISRVGNSYFQTKANYNQPLFGPDEEPEEITEYDEDLSKLTYEERVALGIPTGIPGYVWDWVRSIFRTTVKKSKKEARQLMRGTNEGEDFINKLAHIDAVKELLPHNILANTIIGYAETAWTATQEQIDKYFPSFSPQIQSLKQEVGPQNVEIVKGAASFAVKIALSQGLFVYWDSVMLPDTNMLQTNPIAALKAMEPGYLLAGNLNVGENAAALLQAPGNLGTIAGITPQTFSNYVIQSQVDPQGAVKTLQNALDAGSSPQTMQNMQYFSEIFNKFSQQIQATVQATTQNNGRIIDVLKELPSTANAILSNQI